MMKKLRKYLQLPIVITVFQLSLHKICFIFPEQVSPETTYVMFNCIACLILSIIGFIEYFDNERYKDEQNNS